VTTPPKIAVPPRYVIDRGPPLKVWIAGGSGPCVTWIVADADSVPPSAVSSNSYVIVDAVVFAGIETESATAPEVHVGATGSVGMLGKTEMTQANAFVTVASSVTEPPDAATDGEDAENTVMAGGGGSTTMTTSASDNPPGPFASSVTVNSSTLPVVFAGTVTLDRNAPTVHGTAAITPSGPPKLHVVAPVTYTPSVTVPPDAGKSGGDAENAEITGAPNAPAPSTVIVSSAVTAVVAVDAVNVTV
jgi:hypothetical protein